MWMWLYSILYEFLKGQMVCGLQYEIKETKDDSTFTNTMVKNSKNSASKRAKILNKLLQFLLRYIKLNN